MESVFESMLYVLRNSTFDSNVYILKTRQSKDKILKMKMGIFIKCNDIRKSNNHQFGGVMKLNKFV